MNYGEEWERERKVAEASFSRVTPNLTAGRGEFEKILVLLASASALIASGEKAVAAALWVCDTCCKEEFDDGIGLKDAMLYIQLIGDDAGITSEYSTVSPGGLVLDSYMSAILNRLQVLFPEELTARARRARKKARTRLFSSQAAKRNARNDTVLEAVYDDFARIAEEAAMQSRRFAPHLAEERTEVNEPDA